MFAIVQWDSALDLLIEFLFAVAVFVAIFVVVRRVEKKTHVSDDSQPRTPNDT